MKTKMKNLIIVTLFSLHFYFFHHWKTNNCILKWLRDKYLHLAIELKKTIENKSDVDTNCNWYTRYSREMISTRGLRNKRTSRDHPKYTIVNISQNTEKSAEDLRRLAVTQTQVKNHHLALVWKTLRARWSTGRCARNFNLTIRTNGICTTQHLS